MPTTIFGGNDPLTEIEFERLGEFLCNYSKAMNVEEVDGFFAALIAGPEMVMPSEYLPEVFGDTIPDSDGFSSLNEANDILALLMRHWNDIAAAHSWVQWGFLAEDDFNAMAGLLSMMQIVTGQRNCAVPDSIEVKQIEGWILGQEFSDA